MRAADSGMRSILLACLAGAVVAVLSPSSAPAAEPVALRIEAGQLMGLRVGNEALPAHGVGGFYVQPYRAVTGPNLMREQGLGGMTDPLPSAFAVDANVKWQGEPTLAIRLPGKEETDSGELELHVDRVQPHRTYLLRFAHRGERLAGEFPPILHIRQLGRSGEMVTTQLNLELLCGTYDWKEETVAITAVEGASQFALMLHHPRGMGSFWASPMTVAEVKPEPMVPVSGLWESGGTPRFAGDIAGTPIRVAARAVPRGAGIEVQTTVSAPTSWLRSNPTAMILSFRLPLAASGWRWGDSLRRERTIEPGSDYSRYHLIGRRQFREVSTFPMGAVAGPEHGVALMAPLKPTLLNRMRYDGDGHLCAEFDLGLAARGDGATEEVSFSFEIVRFDPRWGWRSALAAYYDRYPGLFASTAQPGGWWIGPSEQVQALGDFGLQYSEQHFARADRTKAEDGMGIYTCSYSEPWMWRILASEERDLSSANPLSYYLPAIERDAHARETVMDSHDYWTAPRRDSVRAFLNSAIYGPDGEYQVNAVRTYAGTFIEMSTSCLPGIESGRWGDMNRGLLSYRYETLADAQRTAAGGASLDGVYFDSVGNWSDVSAEDHRSEHFRFASYPLTFSYATGTPIISGLAAMAEYMEFIRRKNLITMANSDDSYAAYAAPFLDMIGAGENFDDSAAADDALSHDRSVAYHKSVSFGNSGMLQASPEEAERRFRLLLFYNVYPGIFSSDSESLERARPLYQRYIPLMRQMSLAGWEPVTWATAGAPGVWVERYGPDSSGTAYFALRNQTAALRACTLSIEPAGFGRPAAGTISVTDALMGLPIAHTQSTGEVTAPVTVPPGGTVVVRVEWRR